MVRRRQVITIEGDQRLCDALIKVSRAKTNSYQTVLRARIWLGVLTGKSNGAIATENNCHRNTVSLWKNRLVDRLDELNNNAKSFSSDGMIRKIRVLLEDEPRSGRPALSSERAIRRSLNTLVEAAKNNTELQRDLMKLDEKISREVIERTIAVADNYGMNLEQQDFINPDIELKMEDLDRVAGGVPYQPGFGFVLRAISRI